MRGAFANFRAAIRTFRKSPGLAAAVVERCRSLCRDQGRARMNEVKR
jgi:hypothetical protein